MEVITFVRELIDNLDKDRWEPTDTGYQLSTRNYVVKIRKSAGGSIELEVADYDGKPMLRVAQKQGPEAIDDTTTLKLALLFQRLGEKSMDSFAALDDVVSELRTGRRER